MQLGIVKEAVWPDGKTYQKYLAGATFANHSDSFKHLFAEMYANHTAPRR